MIELILSCTSIVLSITSFILLIINYNLYKKAMYTDLSSTEENTDNLHQVTEQDRILEDFIQEVNKRLLKKKLFPIVKPSSSGKLELLHQNPGTTDTFEIVPDFIVPSEGRNSYIWKRCIARIEEDADTFIKMNKDKLILEEMPNDSNK